MPAHSSYYIVTILQQDVHVCRNGELGVTNVGIMIGKRWNHEFFYSSESRLYKQGEVPRT